MSRLSTKARRARRRRREYYRYWGTVAYVMLGLLPPVRALFTLVNPILQDANLPPPTAQTTRRALPSVNRVKIPRTP